MTFPPHASSAADVARSLNVDVATGLAGWDAAARADAQGPNTLSEAKREPVWRMFLRSATEPFVLMLAAAGFLAIVVGEVRDGLLVLFGLVPIVGADVVTEYRGERALEALRAASAPQARVRRDGVTMTVPAASLVPGDVVLLQAGDVVPADAQDHASGPTAPRPQRADRGVRARGGSRRARRARCHAHQPAVDRLRRNERGRRPRRSGRGGDRTGNRVRADRGQSRLTRTAPESPAAGARPARPDPARRRDLPHRLHDRDRLRTRASAGRERPRRGLRRHRCDPRGATRPARGHPGPGCLPPAPAQRAGPAAERRGDAWCRGPHRDRQDGHDHDESSRRVVGPDAGWRRRGSCEAARRPGGCAARRGGCVARGRRRPVIIYARPSCGRRRCRRRHAARRRPT